MAPASLLRIKIQVCCGPEIAMGPGKADLLAAIDGKGSIAAAARAMGMSYRRAWLLVDAMNRCWRGPLVETVAGGGRERGAKVTPLGAEVLRHYRAMVAAATAQAGEGAGAALSTLLAPEPRGRGTG